MDLRSTIARHVSIAGLLILAGLMALMWGVDVVDGADGVRDWSDNGIIPRRVDGLDGIAWAPLLHGSAEHLHGNLYGMLMLGLPVAVRGARRFLTVTVIAVLVSGVGTWLLGGSGSVHLGASGLVFGLGLYCIVGGLLERTPLSIVIAVLALVLWGQTLSGGLLPVDGVSWQGHLFGAVGGVVAAWTLHGSTTPWLRAPRLRRSRPPAQLTTVDALLDDIARRGPS